MAVRIQAVFLLAVLPACAFGIKIGVVTQGTGHGANAKKVFELWASLPAVSATKDFSPDIRYVEWVKSDAAALIKPMTTFDHIECVDILVGPYGSGDNIAMINEVDASFEGVILVWGGASGSIFTSACANLNCFGFFTTAAYYMNTGIQAVDALETDPVKIALITNNNAFSKSVSAGAKMMIEGAAGVELVGEAQLDAAKADLSENDKMVIHEAISMQPDMYVIAGHNKDVEPVIMMIAESGMVPKAILATNSITSTALSNFAERGMEEFASCVMMPTQWAELPGVADSIIGWTTADFKQAMGDAATYHSASAAAAAIAISHAMHTAQSGGPLSGHFKELDFESFYGKISFNDHGEILKPMYTQQMQGFGPVIVAPDSGVNKGDQMNYPLSTCSGWQHVRPPVYCKDVKLAYKMAECCGNPAKVLDGGRRLLGLQGSKTDEADLLDRVKRELQAAHAAGGEAKAKELANKMRELIIPYKQAAHFPAGVAKAKELANKIREQVLSFKK